MARTERLFVVEPRHDVGRRLREMTGHDGPYSEREFVRAGAAFYGITQRWFRQTYLPGILTQARQLGAVFEVAFD